ncbi:MAG TPA: type IV pilus secretin PilQ [Desulfobacterales bacterium]|jgi:type IV pilus assembly protein PilQ|nr:type IV pilus secretin PilQ [Desulfobacterales bacterium]
MMRSHGCLKSAVAGVVILLLALGCSQPPKKDAGDALMDKWKAKAQESKGFSPAPSPQAPQELVKEAPARAAEPRLEPDRPLPVKRVSLKMSNVDVSVLLRALARAADVNIILNDRVTGRSNINITQSPWDQVFLGILRTHNLTYAWQGDIIRIMTADDLEEELRKEARRRDLQMAEAPVTRIVPVKFAEANRLQENLKSFLTTDKANKPIGSVLVDQHTNSIIVNALPRDMNAILAVLEKLDKPTPQVLIEAFIVEANKDVSRELGVQWGGAYQFTGGDKRGFLTGRDNNALGQGVGNRVDPTTGNVIDLPIEAASASSFGFIFQNVGKSLLAAQLTALQEEGKLTILSSPSITTLDNQMAMIESGRDVPFQSVEDGEVNIQYKKAVLSLKVTPHVIDSQTLKMAVKVNKDEVDFSNQVLGNPTIITKNAETNVIQVDGQTLVIGGLNKEQSLDNTTGTPGLLDVPILGWLFKKEGKTNAKEDLLIFITPTILKAQASPPAGG